MKGVAAHANGTKISHGPVLTEAVRTVLILRIQRIPANAGRKKTMNENEQMQIDGMKTSCPYGIETCLCCKCQMNAAYEKCSKGYCIECYECEEAEMAVHNVYFCSGFLAREDMEGHI